MTQRRSSRSKPTPSTRSKRSDRADRGRTRGRSVTVADLPSSIRLDRYLRDRFPTWGRSAVQSTITAGSVRINGRKVWICSWQVENGDRIEILSPPPEKTSGPSAFDDAWLISTDEHFIAVDKPAGLLSHATRWTKAANLLDLAQGRFGPLTLFHRLDRDTSGVVLLTRSHDANRYLDQLFRARTVHKSYIALVRCPNKLAEEGEIAARIGPHPKRRDMQAIVERGGQHAITHYRVEWQRDGVQRLHLQPVTGRTHQLRVHLASMAAPILGDRLYGPKPDADARLMLHAWQVELPAGAGFAARTFAAPLPDGFD